MYLSLSQNNYRQAMCRMLKENQFLDVIIILYIRAVCLREFKRNRSNIKEMTIGDEEKCIMNFGQEA